MNETSFSIDSTEGPYNSGKSYENGNMGHRPGVKGGYFPVPPVDSAQDIRGEYLKGLRDVGITVEKHHHEVAPSQHELGMLFGTLVDQADNVQLYKYVVQMVSHSFGKTATFMPLTSIALFLSSVQAVKFRFLSNQFTNGGPKAL
mgnify:CR=1 FL=1